MKFNSLPLVVFIFILTGSVRAQEQGFFLNQWTPETTISPQYTDVKQTTDSVTTSIKVLFNDTITKISTYMFGDNATLWTGCMSNEPKLMKYMSDRRMSVLRYPSCFDKFFWNRTPEQRPSDMPASLPGQPTIPFEPWYGMRPEENWSMVVDSFYSVLKKTTATGMITVNYDYARYGTGLNPVATAAHLAADWVRYDKGRTKFWEIGNEVFGDWTAGYRIDKALNKDGQPEFINGKLYGQHCLVFIDSMRTAATELGVDIKIGIPMADSEIGYTPSWATWNKDVASIAGDKADFYTVHSYYTPWQENSDVETILNSYKHTGNYKSYIWSEVDKAGKPHLPVMLGEFNIFAVGSNQQVSHINGMHAVLVTGEALKKGYGAALRWDLANLWDNGNDHGMFSFGNEPGVEVYTPRPAFFHLYFQRRFTGDVLLNSTMRGDTNNVAVFPTSFSSGQAGITIINKGRDNEVVRLNIQDFKFGNRYYTYTITGEPDQDFSRKVFINGIGNSLVAGGPENYDKIQAFSSLINKEIKIKLPPLSSTFILVEPGDKELVINENLGMKPVVPVTINAIPKILFDDSHNERNSISDTRAKILNPEHPDWVSFSTLKSKLIKDFVVENYESGTISASLLKNYDVLVLSAPNDNFSSSEIMSIVSFVNEGGSLCFLGDVGLNGNYNSLLNYFGIKFESSSILGPTATGQDPGCLAVSSFINHVSLGIQPQFFMNYGGSFSITSPAIALGSANNLFWRDFDWNKLHDINEPSGPFSIFTAAIYGMGKVFCISDNALHDDYLKWGTNDKIFTSAMKWLTAKPTAPNLLSPLNAESGVFTNTKLEWASVESTNYYRIQISKSQDFKSILVDSLIGNTSVLLKNLDIKVQYYWRVNATNSHGESKWSAVWNFTTKAYNFLTNTGNSASIKVPVSSTNQLFQVGDEIGIFTPQGLCIGNGKWENKDLVITVWGDNDQTTIVDGIKAGEQFSYRIWKRAAGLEQNIDCLTYSLGNGKYTPNGSSIISLMNIHVSEAGIISGKTNICTGSVNETYSVPTITGANSYIWSLPTGATGSSTTNSITINYGTSAVSGNIAVKGHNECGDGSVSTLPIVVNKKPTTPTVSLIGNGMHSDALIGNQWYNKDGLISGATTQDFSPKSSGDYYVIVSTNGCASNSSNSINYIPTGIYPIEKVKTIKVYPNPVTNELIIEFKGNTNKTDFEVINSVGQVVFTGILLEKEIVQTNDFVPGVYLVKLKSGDTFEFKKVLKN